MVNKIRWTISAKLQCKIALQQLMMRLLVSFLLHSLSRRVLFEKGTLLESPHSQDKQSLALVQVPFLQQRPAICYWGIDIFFDGRLIPSFQRGFIWGCLCACQTYPRRGVGISRWCRCAGCNKSLGVCYYHLCTRRKTMIGCPAQLESYSCFLPTLCSSSPNRNCSMNAMTGWGKKGTSVFKMIRKKRERFDAMNLDASLSVNFKIAGVALKKSLIRHPQADLGISAGGPFVQGIVAG